MFNASKFVGSILGTRRQKQMANQHHLCYDTFLYELTAALLGAVTRRPFSTRLAGNGAWQLVMCDFKRGILGCALLHRWQRNSIDNTLSSSSSLAFPQPLISSITSTESRKKAVVNEFQCFLFFRCFELKSWLITCRWSCRIDGVCIKDVRKGILVKIAFSGFKPYWQDNKTCGVENYICLLGLGRVEEETCTNTESATQNYGKLNFRLN